MTLKKNLSIKRYGLTISPPYRNDRPKKLYKGDVYLLQKWLNKFSKMYSIYPEFDNNSRLHYHITLDICDLTKYHHTKYIVDKTIGYVKLNTLKTNLDLIGWQCYCQKDYWLNREHLTRTTYKRLRRIYEPLDIQSIDIGIMQYFFPSSK